MRDDHMAAKSHWTFGSFRRRLIPVKKSTTRLSVLVFATRVAVVMTVSFLSACGGSFSPESLRAFGHYQEVVTTCRLENRDYWFSGLTDEQFDSIARQPASFEQAESEFGDSPEALRWRTAAQEALLDASDHTAFRQCVDSRLQEEQAMYRQVAGDPERAVEWGWTAGTSAAEPWPMLDANVCVVARREDRRGEADSVMGDRSQVVDHIIQYDRLSLAWTSAAPDPISGASASQEVRDYARGNWALGPYVGSLLATPSDADRQTRMIFSARGAINAAEFMGRVNLPWAGSSRQDLGSNGGDFFNRAFVDTPREFPQAVPSVGCYLAQERATLTKKWFEFLTRGRISYVVLPNWTHSNSHLDECVNGTTRRSCDTALSVALALEQANFTAEAINVRRVVQASLDRMSELGWAAAEAERQRAEAELAEQAAVEQEAADREAGAARARANEARAVTNAACMTQCRQRADAATCARVCANAH